jgi:hypothetical protein
MWVDRMCIVSEHCSDILQQLLISYCNYAREAGFNLLKPTGHVMYHQFNIQQLYVLPTLYLCVLYLSENKQRIAPLTA